MLQGHRQDKVDGEAIFPKYARPRGSDAASAMMMKRLRTVITDRKLTVLPAPPHEGRAMKHRLPGGRLHGHPGTQLQHGGRQLRFRLRPGGHAGAFG